MSSRSDREELHRRLAQSRRLASAAHDTLTRERLTALVADLEAKLAEAEAEAENTDAPPT